MATVILVPHSDTQRPPGSAWVQVGSGINALQQADAIYYQSNIPTASVDSQSADATNWRDTSTGLPFNWASKRVDNINISFTVQANLANPWMAGVVANQDLSGPIQFLNSPITLPAFSQQQVLIFSQAPTNTGFNNTADFIAYWLSINQFLLSIIHSNRSGTTEVFDYNSARLDITYTNLAPPPPPINKLFNFHEI